MNKKRRYKIFLIQIKKAGKKTYWYNDKWYIGKEYIVKHNDKYKSWQILGTTKYVGKRDAKVLQQF